MEHNIYFMMDTDIVGSGIFFNISFNLQILDLLFLLPSVIIV